jgi:hypothetical protein
MGWDSEAQWFWTCTNVNQFGYIRPNGAYVQGFGAMAGQAKGILVLPTSIPSVSTLPLGTTTQGTASTPVSFNLNGSNLFGDITIAAPSGVEVSLSAGSGYTNSLAVPRSSTSGELNQTQIFARITSGAPQGAITGVNLTLTALGADAVDISLTGQVDPAPTPPEMDVLNGVTSIADGGMDPQGIVTVSASQMITYTIQNSGSQDLNLTGTPLVSLANANNVQNLSVSIAPSTPIAGMSSDAFEVSYEAIVNGVFSFTISIDNNDSNENPYNWTVSGTAQALPPPEMDVLNGASAIASGGTDAQGPQLPLMTHTITYTIENNGGANLLLNGTPIVVVTPGTNIVSAVVNVMPASSIAMAASVTFDLAYEVGGTGAFDISISIANNDPDENPYTWSVTGTVMVTPPEMDVTRGANPVADGGTDTLPTQQIGNISVTYTITNSGGSALSVGTAIVSGETNCAVAISAQPSSIVAVAGMSTLELVVTPAAAGAYSFAVSIPNNDSNEDPYDISVNGNVTAPPNNNDDGDGGDDDEGGCSTSDSGQDGLLALLALLGSAAVATRLFRSRAHA